jgi:hypothetical protein
MQKIASAYSSRSVDEGTVLEAEQQDKQRGLVKLVELSDHRVPSSNVAILSLTAP